MGKSKSTVGFFSNLVLVIGLVSLWASFAPAKWGGQVSYVMIQGISMEPNYHTGDLVLVRQADKYQIGDVIAYFYPDMRANVIHRIIGVAGGRFTVKGDNNSWIDGYQPAQSDILGKKWIYVPKLATAVQWLQKPLNMALTAGLLGGLLMVNMTQTQSKKPGKRKKESSPDPELFEIALYVLGVPALALLALAVFAFTRPLQQPAEKLTYTQTGAFFYSGAGTPLVYDSGSAISGDPLFLKLNCALKIGFMYAMEGDQINSLAGLQNFYGILKDEQSGWQRTIPIATQTAFSGNVFTTTATLDLCQVQDLAASVAKLTGLKNNSNTLRITSHISVVGNIAGQDFTDSFDPDLTFSFDSLHFYLAKKDAGVDPLKTVKPSALNNPAQVDTPFNLFGIISTVRSMRAIAGYGLLLCLLALAGLGIYYYISTHRGLESAIKIRYGSMVVDVYDRGLESITQIIDVTSIDDLAKMAERQNAMILHLTHGNAHYYLVQAEGTTYRYVAARP